MNSRPITLEARPVAGGVTLRVLGASPVAFDATFSLAVTAGSNQSIHRGSATLAADDTAVLSTITVTTGLNSAWRAVLHVVPSAGEPYEQVEEAR